MNTVALIVAIAAGVAVVVVSVRLYLVAVRAQAAMERIRRVVEVELTETIKAWGQAAQGVERAAGKIEEGVGRLATTLSRVDRVAERLEPELLGLAALQPALAKVGSWLGGMRRGLTAVTGQRSKGKTGEGVETEAG